MTHGTLHFTLKNDDGTTVEATLTVVPDAICLACGDTSVGVELRQGGAEAGMWMQSLEGLNVRHTPVVDEVTA